MINELTNTSCFNRNYCRSGLYTSFFHMHRSAKTNSETKTISALGSIYLGCEKKHIAIFHYIFMQTYSEPSIHGELHYTLSKELRINKSPNHTTANRCNQRGNFWDDIRESLCQINLGLMASMFRNSGLTSSSTAHWDSCQCISDLWRYWNSEPRKIQFTQFYLRTLTLWHIQTQKICDDR